jgi:hypothetical protein
MLRSNTERAKRNIELITSHVLITRGGDTRFRTMQVYDQYLELAVPYTTARLPVTEESMVPYVVETVQYRLVSLVHGVAIWEEY